MKKITSEDFAGLAFKPRGKEHHPIVQQICFLNLNEAVVLKEGEWPYKTSPGIYFYNNSDKFNGMLFKVRKLLGGGYAVMRVS